MVTINKMAVVSDGKKGLTPVMHIHRMKCNKSIGQFSQGDQESCFVAKYDGERFAVFTASGTITKYAVMNSEKELHEHFDE